MNDKIVLPKHIYLEHDGEEIRFRRNFINKFRTNRLQVARANDDSIIDVWNGTNGGHVRAEQVEMMLGKPHGTITFISDSMPAETRARLDRATATVLVFPVEIWGRKGSRVPVLLVSSDHDAPMDYPPGAYMGRYMRDADDPFLIFRTVAGSLYKVHYGLVCAVRTTEPEHT